MRVEFPISETSPIGFYDPLPKSADVVVIGGGVIGVMTAWYLARAGQRVVLCEKGRIAGEQSSRNWGWIRQQGRDIAELPIMIEALRIWQDLASEIGPALGFRQSGVMYLAQNRAKIEKFADWMAQAKPYGLDTKLLSQPELAATLPNAARWAGAMVTASDARAEPFTAVPLFARRAQASGVVVREACAVRGLELAAGRIVGVMTEAGRIGCERVVLAAGAWSSLFLRGLGLQIPQLSVISSVAATAVMPEFWPGAAADSRFAFRRRADGGYTLAPGSFHELYLGPDVVRHFTAFVPQLRADPFGTRLLPAAPKGFPDAWSTPRRWDLHAPSPFEAHRVLNPRPNLREIERLRRLFAAAFPALGRPEIVQSWAGMIDTMPDTVPILDHAPLAGLSIATGMSGHGFGIGPAVGRVMADLVMGRPTGHDLSRFRYTRFCDGSKIDIGPSL